MYPDWIFFVFWILVNIYHGSAGSKKEYCSYEKFPPSCDDQDEVIVLQSATYGRMYIGRCITEDIGFMSCQSDQLMYLDKECSGKQQCEVDVSSKDMVETTDCSKSLSVFLEAAYTCQKVLQPKSQRCDTPLTVPVNKGSGYLSSTISEDTNCGTNEAPWLLEALPGQRINLTMTDFGWGQSHSLLNRCPTQYGHILDYKENGDVEKLCGGTSRVKQLLLSESHQVQIILDPEIVQQRRFIIKYEAIGCPDMVPPKNGWITKKQNGVTVGCHTDSNTWHVNCIGTHWLGQVGNCSDAGAAVKAPAEEPTTFNSDHVISVAIGSLALVVCCITVTIGVYLVKKHQYKASYMRAGSDSYVVPIPYRSANPNQPTVYTKCQGTTGRPTNNPQQPQQQIGGQTTLPPDITDLNNTTRTGFTFQRPGGGPATILRPTTAVEVHRMPAHMAARSKTLYHPGNGSLNQCHSPRHKTLVPQRVVAAGGPATRPSQPPAAMTTASQQQPPRPIPPPLPHRNEEATSLLSQQQQQNRPRASLPNESAPLNPGLTEATGGDYGHQQEDEEVKYYVLEGPTPTANSDTESNA